MLNRGFGGSQLHQVLHHFDDLFPRYKPERIVLYCGENDLWHGKSVVKTLDEFTTLVTRIRKILPHTPLVYLSCKPSPKRMSKWVIYQDLNGKIKTFCQKDPPPHLRRPLRHSPRSRRQTRYGIWDKDQLHANQAGYARLTKLLGPVLKN